MLAADNTIHRPVVQTLSTRFGEAKLHQQNSVDVCVAMGTGIFTSIFDSAETAVPLSGSSVYNVAAVPLPVFSVYNVANKIYRKQCIINDA